MRKEVWFDEYPNDGQVPKPLQNLPIPSIEFLIIKVRFFKTGVRRPPLAPMTIHPIELYSSIVPMQQLTYLQEVRDFFSPILTPIGAEAEDLKRITTGFLSYMLYIRRTMKDFFNSKELPITVTICAVSQQDEIDEQVRVAATEIGLPSVIMEKGLGEQQQCAICLAELLHGCRATHLPCAQVYHTNCILKWLAGCNENNPNPTALCAATKSLWYPPWRCKGIDLTCLSFLDQIGSIFYHHRPL